MALEEYRRKRDFRKTPEPAGELPARKKAAAPLAFVIQKHARAGCITISASSSTAC